MKILYGVQGTGNGHISRANAISRILAKHPDVEVTWLLSGREANNLFEVEGSRIFRRGLTFASTQGSISYAKTVVQNNLCTLGKDVLQLDLNPFDCLITDYEPVLSWAAKLRGRNTIGIGHQYAFNHQIPLAGDNFLNRALLKHFAPADLGLGLHWHHFGQPILPPICDVSTKNEVLHMDHKVVVYLPFEDQDMVLRALAPLTHWEFFVYSPELQNRNMGHIKTRALSRDGFKCDLHSANAVIANTGFELISECLSLGIKVLTKPVAKQMEQISNAKALDLLGYARVVEQLETAVCRDWLEHGTGITITYPDVHQHIGEWLINGQAESIEALSARLWKSVQVYREKRNGTEVPLSTQLTLAC